MMIIDSGLLFGPPLALFGGSWPRRIYWLWPDDAEPRPTDRFTVLRCFTSAAYRTSPSTNFSACFSRLLLHSFFLDWITATVSRLDSLLTSSGVFNLFITLRFG